MHKFKFGGIDKPGVYLDETVMRMCFTHRRLLSQLALNLVQEGDTVRAKQVLDKAEKEIPNYNVNHDYQSGSLDLVRAYALTGQDQKAQSLLDELWKKSCQYLQWYCSLDDMRFSSSERECMLHIYIMQQMLDVQDVISQEEADKKEKQLEGYMRLYQSKGGSWE
jgi:hypothetical protein